MVALHSLSRPNVPVQSESIFFENEPVLAPYINRVTSDARISAASAQEKNLMLRYEELEGPHTQLITRVKKILDLNFLDLIDNPTYSMCIERLCHLFPAGKNSTVDPEIIDDMAHQFITITDAYRAVAKEAYESIRSDEARAKHPAKLLNNIVEWLDFSGEETKSLNTQILAVSDFSKLGSNGCSVIKSVIELTKPDGKAFLIGDKEDLGALILNIVKNKAHNGYPYSVVNERGGWSFDYFVSDYIRKTGFSPLLNVVMSFAEETTGAVPYVRIAAERDIWLMKFDFGKVGWLPSD